MKYLVVVDITQMKGTVSHIFDMGSSFDFMIKNGKLVVIAFLTFTYWYKYYYNYTVIADDIREVNRSTQVPAHVHFIK